MGSLRVVGIAIFLMFSCVIDPKETPTNTSSSKESDIESILITANKYYERDEFEKASKQYQLALRLDSTLGEAYFKLGYSLLSTKKSLYEEAQQKNEVVTEASLTRKDTSALSILKNYLKAAQYNYRPADAYYNAGVTMSIFVFDDSAAIELYKKSLKINPEQLEVILMMENAKQRLQAE